MSPLVLLVAGLVLLITAAIALRSLGPRVRVGRLIASTPRVSVAQALALADAGTPRYVRVDGRIDSDQEFEDADHRPLVLRRTQVQVDRGGRWASIEDGREAVPFTLNEGLDTIAIDGDALSDGLVVVPRQSVGTAGDLGDRAAGVDPSTPVRIRIEQVSSVEHATAIGVPVRDPAGGVRLTAGLGRPLVLTTLEPRDAMRILAEGRTAPPRVAAACIAGGLALVAAAGLAFVVELVS